MFGRFRSIHLRRPAPVDSRPRMPADLTGWIRDHRAPFDSYSVASLVPDVFEAYARVLHPARSSDQAPIRWSDVAAWAGRLAYPLAQWEFLSVPARPRHAPAPFSAPPRTGGLPAGELAALLDVLRLHTTTPGRVFIAVWEGYGWVREQGREDPVLDLDKRSFLVREGVLTDALEIGWRAPVGALQREPPTLIWPMDRAWFVAADTDLDSTYLGGPRALVDDLVNHPVLEAWEVRPSDSISLESDTVNREG